MRLDGYINSFLYSNTQLCIISNYSASFSQSVAHGGQPCSRLQALALAHKGKATSDVTYNQWRSQEWLKGGAGLGEGRGSEALLGVGLAVWGLHMEPPWGWSQTGREVSSVRYEGGVQKYIVLV